jgi:hypothetical protein
MKLPRLRLSWLMVAVVLAAINLTVMRAALDSRSFLVGALALGAMPLGTALGIGVVIGYRSHKSGPFLSGFETFGTIALAVYVAACLFDEDKVGRYIGLCVGPIAYFAEADNVGVPLAYFVTVVALLMPELTFALIGGWFSKKYKIIITRRKEERVPNNLA